ncbi:MAG: serine/threonine-protein kinase, partial [Gemmataceae bacterium]
MTGDSVTLQVREVLATAKHLDAQRVVTLLRFDQRDRWLRHQHIPAETYIRELAAAGNTQNALDLVVNEFLIREEMGQNPSFDEYGQRFPQFRAQLEEQVKLFRQLGSLVKPASGQASTDTPQPVATVPAEHIHIPGYQVFRRIGNGATGAVYKAKQLSLNRMVAIKTIDAARFQPVTVQRFQRDTQAATKLGHANVARIFDRGVTGSQHFVAMEYVEGFSLGRLVESWGKLPIPLACECVLQVCHALQHLHENGLVHRDVKPGHLVLTTDVGTRSWADESVPPFEFWSTRQFVVKLIDMGLAHAIALEAPQSGEQVGSPEYIAPEQLANAQQVDIRADLYSLGCTFYYLLSGKVPFEGRNVTEILDKHRWAPPRLVKLTRPDVPMELAEIIRKLMGKRPEERFQTPAEAEAALKGLMAKERALFEPAEQLRSKTEPGPALAAQPAGMAGTAAAPAAPTAGGTKSLPLPGRVRLPDPAPPAAPGSAPQAPAAPTAPQAPAAASPPPTSPARPTIPSIELTPTPGRANIEMTPTPRSALSKFEQLRNRQKLASPSWAGTTPRPPVEAPRPEPTLKPEGVKPPDSLEPPPPKRKG